MYKSALQKTVEKNNKIRIVQPKKNDSPFSVTIDIPEKDFKKLLDLELTEQ